MKPRAGPAGDDQVDRGEPRVGPRSEQRRPDDAGLQQEFRTKLGDPEKGIPTGELAAFAAGKGYEFSVEEMAGELSDDQLGAVNGGASGEENAYKKGGTSGELKGGPLFQKAFFNFSLPFCKYE